MTHKGYTIHTSDIAGYYITDSYGYVITSNFTLKGILLDIDTLEGTL